MKRRQLIKAALLTPVAGLAVPLINTGRYKLFAQSQQTYSDRAIKLVNESLVIDMLNQFMGYGGNPYAQQLDKWLTTPATFTEADFLNFKTSGINVFSLGHGNSNFEDGIQQFARWNGFIAGYSNWLLRIDSAKALEQVKGSGKVGIILALQTSSHFRTTADVDVFAGLGQRVSQLTHNQANTIGSSFFEPTDGGLTYFGLDIVKRMNEKGMAVDVSHCGDKTTLDALDASTKPVIISHAGCRGVTPKLMRNKTDEMVKKMAGKGGVIGMPFIRFMIREQEPVNIDHVIDHVDHVAKLVGIEHVGIGSDYDLYTEDAWPEFRDKLVTQIVTRDKQNRYNFHAGPNNINGIEKLNHPKRTYDFTEALIKRKYSDENIRLILGNNFKRALTEIWEA